MPSPESVGSSNNFCIFIYIFIPTVQIASGLGRRHGQGQENAKIVGAHVDR
jgi:hypothetical protein